MIRISHCAMFSVTRLECCSIYRSDRIMFAQDLLGINPLIGVTSSPRHDLIPRLIYPTLLYNLPEDVRHPAAVEPRLIYSSHVHSQSPREGYIGDCMYVDTERAEISHISCVLYINGLAPQVPCVVIGCLVGASQPRISRPYVSCRLAHAFLSDDI